MSACELDGAINYGYEGALWRAVCADAPRSRSHLHTSRKSWFASDPLYGDRLQRRHFRRI